MYYFKIIIVIAAVSILSAAVIEITFSVIEDVRPEKVNIHTSDVFYVESKEVDVESTCYKLSSPKLILTICGEDIGYSVGDSLGILNRTP